MGCVVPKRQARRAVTRNLIKRQVRDVARRHEKTLMPGLWLVRLRQGFPAAEFPSADSIALRRTVRIELERLFDLAAAAGEPRVASPRGSSRPRQGSQQTRSGS
jgi:ribonuclease P protein component